MKFQNKNHVIPAKRGNLGELRDYYSGQECGFAGMTGGVGRHDDNEGL